MTPIEASKAFIESFTYTDNPLKCLDVCTAIKVRQVEIGEAFGRAVKIRRIEVGISQEELAHKADFARSFLSAIELGRKGASIQSVWRLAQALNCKPSELWITAERLMQEGAQ